MMRSSPRQSSEHLGLIVVGIIMHSSSMAPPATPVRTTRSRAAAPQAPATTSKIPVTPASKTTKDKQLKTPGTLSRLRTKSKQNLLGIVGHKEHAAQQAGSEPVRRCPNALRLQIDPILSDYAASAS